MTLPIIMEDIRDRGLSLNAVAMATKAKAEPGRAQPSPEPVLALLTPVNVPVVQVNGVILKRRINPRLSALENLLFPKVTKKAAAAKAKALAPCRLMTCAWRRRNKG